MTILKSARRITTIATGVALLALGGLVASPGAANAATPNVVTPFHAQGCNGDVCMYLSTPVDGQIYIDVWAYNKTFTGYFHLIGPDGLSTNGTVQKWTKGDSGAPEEFFNLDAIVGKYCVIGHVSGGGTNGEPCESVE